MAIFRRAGLEEVMQPASEPVPPGFEALSAGARRKIIHKIAEDTPMRGDDRVYMFRFDGTYVRPDLLSELDWAGTQRPELMRIPVRALTREEARRIRYLIEGAMPYVPPEKAQTMQVAPTHKELINMLEFVPIELDDELGAWFADDRGRTWRSGAPWPPVIPPESEWAHLAPAVIAQIRKEHLKVNNEADEKLDGSRILNHLYDPKTGKRVGLDLPAFHFTDDGLVTDAGLSVRKEFYVCLADRQPPDVADLESIRIDPLDGHVTPWPCGVKAPVSA